MVSRFVTPGVVVAFYLLLAAILGVFTFTSIPPGPEYKAIAAVGGVGVTLLLGLMGQSLAVLNTREQIGATRENLTRQIESTERLADAQRAHTAALAARQSVDTRELESLRAVYSLVQQQYKMQEERSREKEKEYATIRLNHLDPLRVAAADLAERMVEIHEKVISPNQLPPEHPDSVAQMTRRFHQVKHPEDREPEARSPLGHIYWCNGEGYFAMSSNYRA